MNTSKLPTQKNKAVEMTNATKKKLKAVSNAFKGKEMFPEKLERAKQLFRGLRPLNA
ncbi:hypothetical protein [Hymenobacter negativus]|uniref:Uncharacterized protein n=1 Tax=Hymenobacter negativus TaxID=2795026 RepID=A0ABS3QJI7_9BACT|nr:hypothetical protein [Hymenobacter negativus]MBO2010870.1 hypothetical protein [Hymenobacter negativus]